MAKYDDEKDSSYYLGEQTTVTYHQPNENAEISAPTPLDEQSIQTTTTESLRGNFYWLTHIDEIITACIPLIFVGGACVGITFIFLKPTLQESDLMKIFISGSLSAGATASRRK